MSLASITSLSVIVQLLTRAFLAVKKTELPPNNGNLSFSKLNTFFD